jgi:hypothetical protein
MNLANFYSWILFRIDNKPRNKKFNQVNLFKYLFFCLPRIVEEVVVVVACSAIMISQEIE